MALQYGSQLHDLCTPGACWGLLVPHLGGCSSTVRLKNSGLPCTSLTATLLMAHNYGSQFVRPVDAESTQGGSVASTPGKVFHGSWTQDLAPALHERHCNVADGTQVRERVVRPGDAESTQGGSVASTPERMFHGSWTQDLESAFASRARPVDAHSLLGGCATLAAGRTFNSRAPYALRRQHADISNHAAVQEPGVRQVESHSMPGTPDAVTAARTRSRSTPEFGSVLHRQHSHFVDGAARQELFPPPSNVHRMLGGPGASTAGKMLHGCPALGAKQAQSCFHIDGSSRLSVCSVC